MSTSSASPRSTIRPRIAEFLRPGMTTVLLYVAPTPQLYARPDRLPQVLAALRPDEPGPAWRGTPW
ncbi:hypothetical protein [Streptomyces litchfieldiae]|uniref:Uncharacterized protein n=1 Tax=Streptomyces litchfieldiae TaxID=3075543 RepID=A0ABU2MQ67_9ACTN|nr:hypothetical protein [Streptomyces sp. DSM 44938]MDT0343498.1 hypothetical protein [Streptomyces sp. DSM 44938]